MTNFGRSWCCVLFADRTEIATSDATDTREIIIISSWQQTNSLACPSSSFLPTRCESQRWVLILVSYLSAGLWSVACHSRERRKTTTYFVLILFFAARGLPFGHNYLKRGRSAATATTTTAEVRKKETMTRWRYLI